MSPRPSSPTCLLAADRPLMSNDEEEASSASHKGSLAEDEMLTGTLEEPVETAYAHQTKGGTSPLDRPKKRFGTANTEHNDTKVSSSSVMDIDSSPCTLMAAITNDDDDNSVERQRAKRSWEIDDIGEEAEEDEHSDEPVVDSQDTADTSPNPNVSPEAKQDNADEAEEPQSNNGTEDVASDVFQSQDTAERAKQNANADESDDEKTDENTGNESTPVEQYADDDAADKIKRVLEENSDKEEDSDKDEEQPKPTIDDLKLSVEYLFCEADKQTVTVKAIYSAVEAEHSISLEKGVKKILRSHLVALMQGDIKPSVGNYVEDGEVGDEEESESSSDESSDEEEQPSSEYEDGEETQARGSRPTKKKQRPTVSKTKKDSAPSRRKSTRKPRKSKKGSIHAHAEKLREKRMQELRVRNEELQLAQSKEDQKRAEMIAAKFETNSDELRLERLEARLDLLQQLGQKRLKIMTVKGQYEDQIKEEPRVEDDEDNDTDSDDDDCMELEIVGPKNSDKPLFPSITSKPDPRKTNPLSAVLDLADKVSPMKKDPSKKNSLAKAKKQRQLSPSRSKDARAMLRNTLKSKQRKMGNMWLARELGYKNEKDHLRDCWETEKKKREQVLKMEAERLATNERAQLRERLRDPEPLDGNEPEKGESQKSEYQEEEEEEDEEMQLAKQMELEKEEQASADDEIDVHKIADSVQQASDGKEDEDGQTEKIEATQTEYHGEHVSGAVSINDDNKECTQESTFPDAQEDLPINEEFEDTALKSNDTQTPLETKTEGGVPSSEQFDESQEDSQFEARQFETQAPLVVSRETEVCKRTNGKEEVNGNEKTTSGEDKSDFVDTDDEEEFVGNDDDGAEKPTEAKKDRNAAWKAMLQKEADKLKKSKKGKKGNEYLEAEAEEEEEEEVVGLEDFGFAVHKKKENDEEDDNGDEFNEDDLKDVVDDVSDDEGDEETGEKMRRAMAEKEEKERHKEMLRRMREGYDGRRGGIAGSGAGARGVHRFDQLVAADNKETAKRLGLLNDDELDSDDEGNGADKGDNEEEDEAALIDKMLKDRFLHRNSEELEENFSEDEEDEEDGKNEHGKSENDEDDMEQEILAKRFAKRARMQRLMEQFGSKEEFTDSRLIEEDTNMKEELARMKNGLARKRSITSVSRISSLSSGSASTSGDANTKRQKTTSGFGAGLMANSGSLSLALQSSRLQSKGKRTSFLGSQSSTFSDIGSNSQKSISFNHVVFQSDSQMSFRGASKSQPNSQHSFSGLPGSKLGARRPPASSRTSSLWSKVMTTGPQKRC